MKTIVNACKVMILLIFIVLCFSCKQNTKLENENQYKSKGDNYRILSEEELIRLERLAIDSNNIEAYSELQRQRLTTRYNYQMQLNVAIQMANRNDCAIAYYNVFDILSRSILDEKRCLNQLDTKTRCLAIYYLLKAYEKGDSISTKKEVQKIFKDKAIPKASYYLYEMAKDTVK